MAAVSDHTQALLSAVHTQPGLTRAEAGRRLRISSGRVAEVVAGLVDARLLTEGPPLATGGRGRPTRRLGAHPDGPIVLAAALSHEEWRVDAVELGGVTVAHLEGRHPAGPPGAVLGTVADAVAQLRARLPGRVRGLGISAPGLVTDERFVDAPALGWQGVDLWDLWPEGELVVADNDATLSALAEAWRGAATGARLALHLRIDAGLGGALVEGGRLIGGARGVGGEFGHMPLGDPAVQCPCGARGCWGTAVDGSALARALGAPAPHDPVTFARRVTARAEAGEVDARAAVGAASRALGQGIAGLVNALDPDVVTVGGLGTDLLAIAREDVEATYRDGLMRVRRDEPTPVVAAALGEEGPVVGAAERAWQRLLARLP